MEALCGGHAANWQRRGYCLVAFGRRRGRAPARTSMEALSGGHAGLGLRRLPRACRGTAHAHPGIHGGIERQPSGQLAEVRLLLGGDGPAPVSYTHLRAHETSAHL
eukprot:320422-Alexandrium_andersonii.AAC.1